MEEKWCWFLSPEIVFGSVILIAIPSFKRRSPEFES